MNRLKVVVFGGSGFIGTPLTQCLLTAGHDVRIADIAASKKFPALWTFCDVRDLDATRKACEGMDVIYNLAALHGDDVRPRDLYYDTNVGGAETTCRAAEIAGVHRIIFTSSIAVYGLPRQELDEEGPLAPFNDYGRSKLRAEDVYRKWARAENNRCLVVVRPALVFGEGNRGNLHVLMCHIAAGRFVMVGNGRNRKSMAYVENVAAFLEFVNRYESGEYTFNYADKPDYDTNDLVAVLRALIGKHSFSWCRLPYWFGYGLGMICDVAAQILRRRLPVSAVRVKKFHGSTQFDTTRATQTGFIAPLSLRDGLVRTIRAEFPKTGETP